MLFTSQLTEINNRNIKLITLRYKCYDSIFSINKFILIRRERNEQSFGMFNEILVDR